MSNAEVVRGVYEAYASGELARVDEFVAEDMVDHHLPPGLAPGREGFKAYLAAVPFTDLSIAWHDQLEQGEMVASRFTLEATHSGSLRERPTQGSESPLMS